VFQAVLPSAPSVVLRSYSWEFAADAMVVPSPARALQKSGGRRTEHGGSTNASLSPSKDRAMDVCALPVPVK